MKKSVFAASAVLAACLVNQANATELWEPHLPGADEGMVAGALPPEGVYMAVTNYWATFDQYDKSGNKNGVKLDALVVAPVLLWSTGAKVLGGDFGMAVAQPYTYTNLKIPASMAPPGYSAENSHTDRFNTILVPAMIGWHLSPELHVKSSLFVSLDNAGTNSRKPAASGGAASGNSYRSIMPEVGLSYLHDGWHLSVDTYWDLWNTTDHDYRGPMGVGDYKSGKMFQADYTAMKSVGDWSFGVGAFQVKQFTDDTGAGAAGCAANNGCRETRFGIGPMFSYQAGKVNITAIYNHDLRTENAVGGNILNVRLLFPLK